MAILSDKIEYYECDGELKKGSLIQVKIKNIDYMLPILVTEVDPYRKINTEYEIFICSEKDSTTFEESSPEKTKIIFTKIVQSPFLFFMKLRYLNELECHYSKMKIYLDKLAAEMHEVDFQCL